MKKFRRINSEEAKLMQTLHTQFAENQNHWQGNFIQLLAALLVIFGGLGYIFAHWEGNLAFDNYKITKIAESLPIFTTSTLLWSVLVTNLLLTLIILLIIHFGWSYRRDQILNNKIRYLFFKKNKTIYKQLFGCYGKKTSEMPDFYKIFMYFGVVFQIVLLLFLFYIMAYSCLYQIEKNLCSLYIGIWSNVFCILATFLIEMFYYHIKHNRTYKKINLTI